MEICGFILAGNNPDPFLFPCVNVSRDPAHSFEIGERDHIAALGRGRILAVYHSHPNSPGFSAGDANCDLERAQRIALPFYLYTVATDTWEEYLPPSYRPPLAGRDWVTGMADCYETVRVYFRHHHGLHMGDYDRDGTVNLRDLILARFAAEGFHQVDITAAQIGDVLMFKSDRLLSNHFGVLTGPSQMLHHLQGGLSCVETVSGRWLARAVCVFRLSTPKTPPIPV